jgi:preprotein translocase subunit SecD
VVDKLRAKDIIGKTAQLEFRLVEKRETFEEILKKIDEYIYEKLKTEKDTSEMLEQPLLSLLYDGKVAEGDTSLFMTYIRTEGTKELIPSDVEILWSKTGEVIGVEEYLEPLLVKKKPCLTGDAIVEAVAGIGTSQNPIGARVDLVMKASARHKWARITGANVGRRIAIVMDGVVQSAPVVRERIVGGNSMIDMGGASFEEAQDLALIIRAGALPAPVKIIEERTVGASLGEDSIRKGIQAVYIGGGAILLFMVIYYSACGLLANLALVFNLLFLLAILSGFKATLTLPGIAGILLVVGTAVDANILIFERIREELRAGRTVRSAIDAGYSRAFRTIIDANVTTFLVGLILYYFGTGPIKGFAITLMIGIVANIFTAIVLTKLILDYLVYKGVRRIAI